MSEELISAVEKARKHRIHFNKRYNVAYDGWLFISGTLVEKFLVFDKQLGKTFMVRRKQRGGEVDYEIRR